jgi:hypothetical protein
MLCENEMTQLPSFLVIGVGKCGTTSIHEYLRQNPSISLPRRKETHFFVYDKASGSFPKTYLGRTIEGYIDNLDDYLAEFDVKPSASIFGEVCPSYYFYPNAAANIKKYIPNARLICFLRNPVERFYSEFNSRLINEKTRGIKENDRPKKFDDLVATIIDGSASELTRRWLEIGLYSKHLSPFFDLFPGQNIKLFLVDDLVKTPQKVLAEITDFIGALPFIYNVDMKFNVSGEIKASWFFQWAHRINIAGFLRDHLPAKIYQPLRINVDTRLIKKADPISENSRRVLRDFYREDILNLQKLIGRDLSAWLA